MKTLKLTPSSGMKGGGPYNPFDEDDRYPFARREPQTDPLRNLGVKIDVPEFDGKAEPDVFIDWIQTVERVFDLRDIPDNYKVKRVFVPGAIIPNKPAYRMNLKENEELHRQVTELLERRAIIPNKPAYRMNLKENEELHRQVTELLERSLIREGMNSCAVPALLVPELDDLFDSRTSLFEEEENDAVGLDDPGPGRIPGLSSPTREENPTEDPG